MVMCMDDPGVLSVELRFAPCEGISEQADNAHPAAYDDVTALQQLIQHQFIEYHYEAQRLMTVAIDDRGTHPR